MAVSEVSICNSGLIKIGVERINSFDDTSKQALLCKEQYPKLRDEVLRAHPWNFAINRKQLGPLVDPPLFEFGYQFQLPTDCLKVIKADQYLRVRFKIEGRKLLTDEPTIDIQYITRVEDPTEYDSIFQETLAWRIAWDLSYPMTNSLTLMAQMKANYNESLGLARSMDAQEGIQDNVIADDWLDSRL